MFLVLLLPFGGALVARFRHQLWQAWAIWGGASLLALIPMWISGSFGGAVASIALASAAGFWGPELWTSSRGFMSHPRVFGWILAAGVGIFVWTTQGVLNALAMVVFVFLGYCIVLRPLFKRR